MPLLVSLSLLLLFEFELGAEKLAELFVISFGRLGSGITRCELGVGVRAEEDMRGIGPSPVSWEGAVVLVDEDEEFAAVLAAVVVAVPAAAAVVAPEAFSRSVDGEGVRELEFSISPGSLSILSFSPSMSACSVSFSSSTELPIELPEGLCQVRKKTKTFSNGQFVNGQIY